MENKNKGIIIDNPKDIDIDIDIDNNNYGRSENDIEGKDIDDNNKLNKDEQMIKELKIEEFKEIFDPIKSAFEEQEKKDEFFTNDNLNSLVLVTDNKNDLIEVKKIKENK